MFEVNRTIISAMPSRKDKMKHRSKEIIEAVLTLAIAGIFVYGFFSLLGLILYVWWLTGAIIMLLVGIVAISYLLWKTW